MNFDNWKVETEQLLHELQRIDPGYPKDENVLRPPTSVEDSVAVRLGEIHPKIAAELDAFFNVCDGLCWPDVNSGYFLKRKAELGLIRNEYDPVKISGDTSCLIVVVGSTGNGTLFAIRTRIGDIVALPNGRIEENTYFDSNNNVCPLASEFSEFLHLLLEDLKAFVTCKQGHRYIV